MGEERLPRRVMFEELFGGKDYSGGARQGLDGAPGGRYNGIWH